MAELKTTPNNNDVHAFIEGVENDRKREDCKVLLELIGKITGEQPKMWGDSIVGYGNYHYVYESGREGDWFLAGFSPRKQSITIYMMGGNDAPQELIDQLGKHKMSVGCLYINKLADVDLDVLKKLISLSVETLKKRYADYN